MPEKERASGENKEHDRSRRQDDDRTVPLRDRFIVTSSPSRSRRSSASRWRQPGDPEERDPSRRRDLDAHGRRVVCRTGDRIDPRLVRDDDLRRGRDLGWRCSQRVARCREVAREVVACQLLSLFYLEPRRRSGRERRRIECLSRGQRRRVQRAGRTRPRREGRARSGARPGGWSAAAAGPLRGRRQQGPDGRSRAHGAPRRLRAR